MIVVSEIGEQWSPQTAPAMQAETAMIVIVEPGIAARTMGIRMPNVPQLVPVEKPRMQAMRKMIAGRNAFSEAAGPLMRSEMKIFAPSESVMPFSVHAQQRIMIAGTIALNPSGNASMHDWKEMTRRHMKKTTANTSATIEPSARPTDASESENAFTKSMLFSPPKNPPE